MSGQPVIEPATIRARLQRVHERIAAAGGNPTAITVVAVTKGFGPAVARAARDAGVVDLGENYAQELMAKQAEFDLDPPAGEFTWHFLGRLQTNKVRLLAPVIGLWQSVDRGDLVREIAKRAPGAAVLIQINLAGEERKGGCSFAEVPVLIGQARDAGLAVRGLMGVGPAGAPADAEPGFTRLVAMADAADLPVRSIGMSADLEAAVRCGATMVRIGTDLFGPRSPAGPSASPNRYPEGGALR